MIVMTSPAARIHAQNRQSVQAKSANLDGTKPPICAGENRQSVQAKTAKQYRRKQPIYIGKTKEESKEESKEDISSAGGAYAPPAASEEIAMVVALASTCATASTTTLPSARTLVYTAPVPKGMVHEKHLWFSGRNPHRKAGFRLAQILWTGAPALALHGFGWGGPTRKDGRTAEPVFFTPHPPAAMKTQTVAPLSRSGAKP